MSWPSIVLLTLAGAVLAILAMPVRVTLVVRGRAAHARVRALAGLVRKELPGGGDRPPAEAARRPGGGDGRRGARRAWALARSRGFLRRGSRFAARLWRALHVGELTGRARIGLDDPADTGELWAVLAPACSLLARRHPDFRVTPSFQGECLEVDACFRLTVVPLELIAITLAFALSPTTLRAGVAAWRTR
jgi:hypothetical protein